MRSLLLILLVLSLVISAGSAMSQNQLPSDLISKQPSPTVLNLQNVKPSAAQAIDQELSELIKSSGWFMPDIGRFTSDPNPALTPENIPTTLLNFSNQTAKIPASIGEGPAGKPLAVNESSGTGLVYL